MTHASIYYDLIYDSFYIRHICGILKNCTVVQQILLRCILYMHACVKDFFNYFSEIYDVWLIGFRVIIEGTGVINRYFQQSHFELVNNFTDSQNMHG